MSEPEVERLQRHCEELNRKTGHLGWFWYVGKHNERHAVMRRDGAANVL